MRGEATLTALELTYMVAMPSFDVYAHETRGAILFSSLAYRTSLLTELPFANVSLGEVRSPYDPP